MSALAIFLLTAAYLAGLFLIARWGRSAGRAFIERHSGHFYALGIAVYATAWTFYGSIGRAATQGLDFLAIYLGPVAIMPVWYVLQKKIVRISKAQHLNSLSDFITARYGKSWFLGILITVLVVMAVTPYLALQISAISSSANALLGENQVTGVKIDLIATVLLLVFTLVYGLRFAFDEGERYGLIAAIGFESAFKLVAAFGAGAVLVYGYLGGLNQVYSESMERGMAHLMTIQNAQDWWWMLMVSAMAFILLPRQFQMAVVSNKNEADIKKAMWLLPLYLLLMNWWVVPIALGGNLNLPEGSHPDYHFLNLALASGNSLLPAVVFLGGLAACTSMIIVSSSALGAMVSSNLLIPATLASDGRPRFKLNPVITKRVAIVAIFLLAYGYYTYFVHQESLVSIGMISFIGIAQLGPGFFGALFWRRGTAQGVTVGLLAGFAVWLTAFGVPQWSGPQMEELGIFNLFADHSPQVNVLLLSLGLNTVLMVGVSLAVEQGRIDRNQAEIFFNILNIPRQNYDQSPVTTGKITFERLEKMMNRFVPDTLLSETLYKRYTIERTSAQAFDVVPSHLVSYAERLLTQVIGPAAARIVLSKEIEEDSINAFDVRDILEETKATQKLNAELKEKTETLRRTTHQLTVANEQLHAMSRLKDDFLYTVTHELRSPLTAIRAQIEIIRDEEDMPTAVREEFLDATISECERLTHLISNVLDIEKFESGNQQLSLKAVDLRVLAMRVFETHGALAASEGISLRINGPGHAMAMADEARIQQVFINLLSNALKYGQKEVAILLAECDGGRWCVSVQDDGPGVPEKDIPHLFDKFYQSNDQTVKKRLGTGLGLAISYNIIKAHGGELKLAQNPPEGPTTFAFTLRKTHSL